MHSYNLISLAPTTRSNQNQNTDSVCPGSYALVSDSGPVLSVTHTYLPIIPRGNVTPKSKPSSAPGSPTTQKRTHDESEVLS